ncbi:hypothetical protein L0Y40_00845 [Candidatus Wolfebacteria bacterium]|nr:hypothetical protein [Candidatus Wolfebacteria bacterium]
MKKHIVIATCDGIGTHYSGVGTIAKNLVFALTKLSDRHDFRVSIAYVNVNKQSRVFNRQCFEDSSNLVNKTGGTLIPLCNSSKGESEWDMWRSFEEWDFACVSLVTTLNMLLDDAQSFNKKAFVIFGATDPKYLHMSEYMVPLYDKNRHALCNHQTRQEEVDCCEEFCMERIRVSDVFDKIKKAYGGTKVGD